MAGGAARPERPGGDRPPADPEDPKEGSPDVRSPIRTTRLAGRAGRRPAGRRPGRRGRLDRPGRPAPAVRAGRPDEPLRRRRRLGQHRDPDPLAGPDRQGRPARLLDVLLHQLPSCDPGPRTPGEEVPRLAGRHRRPLAEVRGRAGHREHPQEGPRVRDQAPGRQRREHGPLAAVQRERLADPGDHRRPRQPPRRRHRRGELREARQLHRQARRRAPPQGRARRDALRRLRRERPAERRPPALPGQGPGRSGAQSPVHQRHRPQPDRRDRPRWQGPVRRRQRHAGLEGRTLRGGAVQPAAGDLPDRRVALRRRHREPRDPPGRPGVEDGRDDRRQRRAVVPATAGRVRRPRPA